MDPPRLHAEELRGSTFTCLPGCGFCCTFPPEVSTRELALLRKRLPVRVTSDGERSHLALHNKCGACTLLERRECQAYDLRPAHCRYFPFHVHFAPDPEVYVNYTCRGVARAGDGDLTAAFRASVLAVARPDEWARHEQAARETYGEFERRARRAGAWGDVDAVLARADLPALGTLKGILAAAARAG
ncbi:MAG TPA: YkgJ family cysteine cluster protein, partial [Candidatus Thermoplasmatota archaeon]|nr:YkgJ family cysteine cluster protein [Candidatus Thermoplasmatota archaeon]